MQQMKLLFLVTKKFRKYIEDLRSSFISETIENPTILHIRIYNTKSLVYNQIEKYRNQSVSINF
jgi:hypothetical protein